MKVIRQSLLVVHVLLTSLAICSFLGRKGIYAPILYRREFNFDKILVQFQQNEKVVLDISKIRYFFMLPNNFYCENVKVNDSLLPLFFINSTKKDLLTHMFSLLKANENDIEKLLANKSSLSQSKDDILHVRKNLRESFPNANSIEDIEREIVESITLPGNKNLLCILENHQSPLSTVNSTRDSSKNSNENIDPLVLEDSLKNWKLHMCYIIPAMYSKFDDDDFLDDIRLIVHGLHFDCYKVAMQFDKKSRHENFVLKHGILRSLKEITIFSHIPTEEQHGFCRPQSLIIDSYGMCVGYLMKYAEFENLARFVSNHRVKDYRYFYNQLFNVAKAINTLHKNGISHNDVHLGNIFVCKKDGANGKNNYYFQLGDFGDSRINYFYDYDGNNDDNISKEHAETEINKFMASLCLDDVNKSQIKPFDCCSEFNSIEKYFVDVDNSFANTNSTKSNEPIELKEM